VGNIKILLFSMLCTVLCIAAMPLMFSLVLLSAIYLFFELFAHAVWPPITSINAVLSPSARRGVTYGLLITSFQVVGMVIQPVVATLIESTSFIIMFPISLIFVLV